MLATLSMVHVFVEMFEMEIVDKMGRSGTRLTHTRIAHRPIRFEVGVRYAACDLSGQELQNKISHAAIIVATKNCAISGPAT